MLRMNGPKSALTARTCKWLLLALLLVTSEQKKLKPVRDHQQTVIIEAKELANAAKRRPLELVVVLEVRERHCA